MNLIYEIIAVNPTDRTMLVRFTTDRLPAELLDPQLETDGSLLLRQDGKVAWCRGDFNIRVPQPEPDAEALREYIVAHAPIDWLEAREAALDGEPSMPVVESLLGRETVVSDASLIAIRTGSV